MFKDYFKVAFRNLVRKKTYTTINVLGLGLGISCAILIFAIISYHLSFDNFHTNPDRIYRLVTESHRDGVSYSAGVPSPLGRRFREDYTYGEKVARVATYNGLITINDGKIIRKFREEKGLAFTEPAFFDIFNYPLLYGDRKTLLNEPNTAILTERVAKKYFGDSNPINRMFRFNNKIDFKVTGVLKDLPVNTHCQSEIHVSYITLPQYDEWLGNDDAGWGGISGNMQCFVKLRQGVSAAQVEQLLPAYVKKYRAKSKNIHQYKLQPLSDIHFNTLYEAKMPRNILWALGFIGLFLIITASVNFINLATAQALNRSKEVGVRKVLGSGKQQLFRQFMFETWLIVLAAAALSLFCSSLALPVINQWFNIRLTTSLLLNQQFIAFITCLIFIVTFLAGSYPAIVLTRFQPIAALKGWISQRSIGGFNIRRMLVIVQFAISQLLIIAIIIIANQIRYVIKTDLGFNKDAVVMLPVASGSDTQTKNGLKEQLMGVAGVRQVSLCRAAPLSDNNWTTAFRYDNHSEDENFGVSVRSGDDQYIPMFGLKLVAGRNVFPSDTVREFVVNETFVRKLNLESPQEAIGKMLSVNGGSFQGPVVGVVKDFHDRSFLEQIQPVCIQTLSNDYNNYAVKINLTYAATTMALLEKTWSERHPDQIFEYKFLDEQIANYYEPVSLMLKLIRAFAAIAVFIGCLGMYGMISFMAAQKRKEIGIRKVLGSSIAQILWIFGREFSRLVLIGFVVAVPLAWIVMNKWLQNFAYRIDIQWWMLAVAGLATIVIALSTISFQSIKAAMENPVKSLRVE
ncbi:MAG: ABC transporter permease [Agriterribacter sp.]